MNPATLIEQLSQHRMIGVLPREELAWIGSHGVLRHLDTNAVLTHKELPVDGLHIILSGHVSIHVETGAGRRKVMEWRGGDVTGLLPYSRLVSPPGNVVAEEPTTLLTVYRADMPEMIRECQELTAKLVHVMLDRARHFTSSYLHDEKLVSLGKLAAGLAHELNNPVSAIARAAGALAPGLEAFGNAAKTLGAVELTAEQARALTQAHEACLARHNKGVLSPLEREEREDAIADWLEQHHLGAAPAETLADSGIDLRQLDQLAGLLDGVDLEAAVLWLAASCATGFLALEIREAATRVSELVSAVKGFTQMDRAAIAEPVDVARGLANTLIVLNSKAKSVSVGLSLNAKANLPRVPGFGGELNQVWSNLIDNAIDAAGEGGRVEITASGEGSAIVVRIVDSGPGVPNEIRDRIFDPFFTTKSVGKGTGLGLDIVRRLVQRHNGRIELDSVPGRTEFRVTLPVHEG